MPVITDEKISLHRRAELVDLLEQKKQALRPLVARRDEINGPYKVEAKAASEAWKAGDKQGWFRHKTRRDELKTPELTTIMERINEIKDGNIPILLELNEINRRLEITTGSFHEYNEERLGRAHKTITYPDNTPEWHEQRAKGIGGSDIGAIMGSSPFNTREDIFKLKTGQTKPEAKTAKGGALARGSAWEEQIARDFAARNQDLKLVHCKASWQSDDRPYQLANLDGLLYEPGSENPSSILEIKTSSVPESWDKEPPLYYRQQVLWYMDAFGIMKAYLAVLIDDIDYRQFEIFPEPGEMDEIHRQVKEFVDEVDAYKEAVEERRYITRHQVHM